MTLPASLRFSLYAGALMTMATGLALAQAPAPAQDQLPEAPGKAATVRICGKCHSPERAVSLHQTRFAWQDTVLKMVRLGAQGSDEEFEAVIGYLAKNFGRETPRPININTADSIDLQAGLLLLRSQANAIIQYREANGNFTSLDDLRKVPGLDFPKIEAKKARLTF